ncbi:hypothetical protein K7432_005048 [Basidiobolus ranarum]|uniref:Uncharacterized protein n=1 Tax=Basidiobolus ranarum TaxID=34480 RepID=A0ABR2WXA0_9FUNG
MVETSELPVLPDPTASSSTQTSDGHWVEYRFSFEHSTFELRRFLNMKLRNKGGFSIQIECCPQVEYHISHNWNMCGLDIEKLKQWEIQSNGRIMMKISFFAVLFEAPS